jgi:hypothetical protein
VTASDRGRIEQFLERQMCEGRQTVRVLNEGDVP